MVTLTFCFSTRFPSLHSHCKQTDYSVAEISRNGLERRLVPRLTPAAHAELQVVNSIIQRTTLSTAADARLSPFALPNGKLHTASLYRMLKASEGESSPASSFIWANHAPPRVRFFAWLLTGDRIQSRANLRRKTVVDNDICELCNNGSETANHIMFECPEASSFWQSLGFILPSGQTTGALPSLPRPVSVPAEHFSTIVLLCCWQLWKRRNDMVFRGVLTTRQQLLLLCREEARLWRCRLPRATASVSNAWCSLFSNAM
ncbi:unnamed protein product [Urochloa humidicola]